MSSIVHSIRIRYYDPEVDELYRERLPYNSYFFSKDPQSLPRLIEADYIMPEFRHWAGQILEENGYEPGEVDLRYAVIDIKFESLANAGVVFSFPFMINSAFRYQGLNIHGPFIAGHHAGISMVQNFSEARYARFLLPPRFTRLFNSDYQTELIAESVHRIATHGKVDGLVAALPDRGRQPKGFVRSNICRVLTGGHIADASKNLRPFSKWPLNPLRGIPFKITDNIFAEGKVPLYSGDFTYYSFLSHDLHDALLSDSRFLRLLDLIRRLGPMFKATFPDLSEGLLFSPESNLEFMSELLTRSS